LEANTPVSTAASLLVDSAAAQLTVISGPQKGSRFNLWPKPGGMIVGRSHDCDLRLEDKNTSRHHARLHCDEAGVLIEDLGSRYGVEVNGETLRGALRLRHGDEIRIGLVRLVVSIASQSTARGRRLMPPSDAAASAPTTDRPAPERIPASAVPPDPDPAPAGSVPRLGFGPRVDTLTPTPVTAELSRASALLYFSRKPGQAPGQAGQPPGLAPRTEPPVEVDGGALGLATAGPEDRTTIDPRGSMAARIAQAADPPALSAVTPPESTLVLEERRARSVTLPLWAALLGIALVGAVLLTLLLRR
jgi:predicted component of type VI protein secretion system